VFFLLKSITSLALSLAVLAACLFGFSTPAAAQAKKDCCPIVFVHGLGGWGQGAWADAVVAHWGMAAGSTRKQLLRQGYEAYAASVGPISSAWDRACELYAQLTGARVDYGAAHAKMHQHDRYGQRYAPLLKGWSAKRPIALVGHSFGGATARLLTTLCEQGSRLEREEKQQNISPLFTGQLKGRILAVVTLAAPHNGSTAGEPRILADGGDQAGGSLADTMLRIARAGMVAPIVEWSYPFRLGQFGVSSKDFYSHPVRAWKNLDELNGHKDSAAYDLRVDGSQELNRTIGCQKNVYYFSYFSQATKPDGKGNQAPQAFVWKYLQSGSAAMGRKRAPFTTAGGVRIDERWLANDGLVNTISAKFPIGDPHKDYDPKRPVRGTWQLMPLVTNFDHVDFGGGLQKRGGAPGYREFVAGLVQLLEEIS
jgi:triacylglycerol lipase